MTFSLSIDHVQLTIPRGTEDEARAFYCTLLGMTEIPKPKALQARGGFWLRLGAIQLHVGCEDFAERTQTKAHIAYRTNDLDAVRSALLDYGVAIVESVAIPKVERFEIRDPFGNRVEFLTHLDPSHTL